MAIRTKKFNVIRVRFPVFEATEPRVLTIYGDYLLGRVYMEFRYYAIAQRRIEQAAAQPLLLEAS